MKMKYSEQAKSLLSELNSFDYDEFEKWWDANIVIGSRNIIEFLEAKRHKEREKNGRI